MFNNSSWDETAVLMAVKGYSSFAQTITEIFLLLIIASVFKRQHSNEPINDRSITVCNLIL